MHFIKCFAVLAAATPLASATPGVNRRSTQGDLLKRQGGNDCQTYIGSCFDHGCNGVFSYPSNTIGTCTAGTYNGCPCEKCGNEVGYVGGCTYNGCNGFQGTCTGGTYQGCPCH